jgi:hypothetical protein
MINNLTRGTPAHLELMNSISQTKSGRLHEAFTQETFLKLWLGLFMEDERQSIPDNKFDVCSFTNTYHLLNTEDHKLAFKLDLSVTTMISLQVAPFS